VVECVHRFILPAAYALLPRALASAEATAMLLAIGLQESRFATRRQFNGGPARGLWQFERGDLEKGGGVCGVLAHRASAPHVQRALKRLSYPSDPIGGCHAVIEHNDVLAGVFARLLLWTDPHPLPTISDGPTAAWDLYVRTWRPGRPKRDTWNAYYADAWARVQLSELLA